MIKISKNFTGGNIKVINVSDNEVTIENEIRDTMEPWFYWAFCVENAQGKTIKFKFNERLRVGYYGAAVSHDLEIWDWTESKSQDDESFTYTFSENENKVYFAHSMLYHPKRFEKLSNQLNLEIETLSVSKKGRNIPFFQFGNGDKYIILTARHHCCESTGSYILEGFIKEFVKNPIEGYSIFCVPFVDYDGVIDGDQGKSRTPYDHNRDYSLDKKAIYSSVEEIRKFAKEHNTVYGFDFHSPWHYGGANDLLTIVQKSIVKLPNLRKFSRFFEEACDENSLLYKTGYDIAPETVWNTISSPTFASYLFSLKTTDIALTLETPYFGVGKSKFSQEKAVNTGKCFCKALKAYVNKKNNTKLSFAGDLLCYPDMTEVCKTTNGFNYSDIFSSLKKLLKTSDCVVGNLETPIAGEELDFTNERYCFNTPIEYIQAAYDAGIDNLCLANNHCMDRGEKGLFNTVENCTKSGITPIGIRDFANQTNGIAFKIIENTTVAFINYTYGTNAFSHHNFLTKENKNIVNLTQPEETLDGSIHLLNDNKKIKQDVLEFYNEESHIYKDVLKPYLDKIQDDIKNAKKNSDLVIFCLHSGGQYNKEPDAYTKMLCNKIKSYGADAIIGLHPHIIQPCDVTNNYLTAFCLGNTIYSKNTVCCESPIEKDYSVILHLYIGDKKIQKITFSLLKLLMKNNVPCPCDTFDLFNENRLNKDDILSIATYFSNQKQEQVQKEYTLL